jgi:hypothetical protein
MKQLNYLAAALMIGGLALVGCNKEENPTASQTQPSSRPSMNTPEKIGAALSPTGADTLMGAKKSIQGVVENATSKNDFKSVTSYFTQADEDRINKTKPDTTDLDAQIDALQKAWKGKYGRDFKIHDLNTEYPDTFLSVAQDSADANRVTATIVASHGLPELKVPFVREGSQWRIDVPDDVDGVVLHNNLLAALTAVNQDSANWPGNEADAAQAVTHHVVAAVLNKK